MLNFSSVYSKKKDAKRRSMYGTGHISLIVLLFLLSGHLVFAQSITESAKQIFPRGYFSGEALIKFNRKQVKSESGFTIRVPLDYSKPELGLTDIYVHFGDPKKKFDPKKPTIVIVDGGPGSPSHSTIDVPIYQKLASNVVRFDQRGVAFSRFDSIEKALNSDFYSSEYTANDIAQILEFLKVKKATLWGASYGTVPATIFANRFPGMTTALVLEGTLFNGYDGYISATRSVEYQLNQVFRGLPIKTQNKINQAVKMGYLDPHTIPDILDGVIGEKGRLAIDEFYDSDFTKLIDETPMEDLQSMLSMGGDDSISSQKKTPSSETHVMTILRKKEFGADLRRAVIQYQLKNGEIVKDRRLSANGYYRERELYFFVRRDKHWFSAERYPFQAPVYYLQGTVDINTPPVGAVQHFKQAAKGPAKLFLFDEAGHVISPAITNVGKSSDIKLFNSFLDQVAKSGKSSIDLSKTKFTKVFAVSGGTAIFCSKFFQKL